MAAKELAPGMGLQDAYCRVMDPLVYPEGDGGREEAQEGDEGHVSWQGVIGAWAWLRRVVVSTSLLSVSQKMQLNPCR